MAIFSSVQAVKNLSKLQKKLIEKSQGGYEFGTYANYAQAFGAAAMAEDRWDGSDRAWLFSDRVRANKRWQVAMNKITAFASKTENNRLKAFGQILDYYKQINIWSRGRGHESRWTYGAYYLVEDLFEAYEDGVRSGGCVTPPILLALLKTLNVEIANYATTQFKRLLHTDYRNSPRKGINAYVFDRDFIFEEQINVAFDAYFDTFNLPGGTAALIEMSGIYNNTNFTAWLKSLDASGITIPVFSAYYESNLSSRTQSFGQDSRVQIPIAMLYPNALFFNDTNLFLNNQQPFAPKQNPQNTRSYFNPAFRNTLRKGSKLVTDPNNLVIVLQATGELFYFNKDSFVYNTYRIVNNAIMKTIK